MVDRSFRIHDASLHVSCESGRPDKRRWCTWQSPDWETFNRLLDVLSSVGFTIGRDPEIEKNYPSLGRTHRYGAWRTLEFNADTYPTGCKFEFYQNIVTVNSNGGRYDFDQRSKMPYLIEKQFELTIDRARAHLLARGFTEKTRVESAVADPLAHFNERWNFESDVKRGIHRFKRGDDGWPAPSELNRDANLDADKQPFWHGDTMLTRDFKGYLRRGRVYGGINGMWMMIYGPGRRDFTHCSHWELFRPGSARATGRKVHPTTAKRQKARIDEMKRQVAELTAASSYDEAEALLKRLRKAPVPELTHG